MAPNKLTPIFYGQVWLCKNNYNRKNSVQQKTRPVIIISNNLNNTYSSIVNIIPITSRSDPRGPYQVKFLDFSRISRIALCEQITTVPKFNLLRYLYTLDSDTLDNIKEALKIQFNLN